ncbi:MAG: cupin domain-containing protein [Pseudomonadota bacterium]
MSEDPKTKPIAALSVPPRTKTAYPAEFAGVTEGRAKRALGTHFGLSQFGVNLTTLAPGAKTALRHWHSEEDEFVYVLSGEVTLVTNAGAALMRAGDCMGFRAGTPDGHRIENRGTSDAVLLEVGTRRPDIDQVHYPDDDLAVVPDGTGKRLFRRKDGTPV